GSVPDRTHNRACFVVEPIRQQDAQLQLLAVGKMHADVALPIGPIAHRVGKPTADFLQCMEDMLAGAEGILTEIRARAVRLTWPPSSQRDAIGLSGRGVRDRV